MKPLGMILLIIVGGFLAMWGTLGLLGPTLGDFFWACVRLGLGLVMLYQALRLSRSL